MCNTIAELGLLLNPDKVEPPNVRMTIMGISVDVIKKTIAIPPGKLDKILGWLLYISKIVQLAKGFLNRMLQMLKNAWA